MSDKKLTYLSFNMSDDLSSVENVMSIKSFLNLKCLNVALTNLNDTGLKIIASCHSLEDLNLQETNITNIGISYLPNLKNLRNLRLKGCDSIDDSCMFFLNKIPQLETLELQETSISEKGLTYIFNPNLKLIILEKCKNNFSHDNLIKFSKRLPDCEILLKGDCTIKNGEYI